MKLLLTSAGIKNETIKKEFYNLVGLTPEEIKAVFIPTAKNVEIGDKKWLIANLYEMSNIVGEIDIVELTVQSPEVLKKRLEWADVIIVGGGNTYYLLEQVRKSGFSKMLPELLKDRVYVGISAGSIICCPKIDVATIDDGDENIVNLKDTSGLNFVDFEVSPHTPDVSLEANKEYAKTIKNKLYAYDDDMAVKVDGNKVELVGNGQHWEYN